MAPAPALALDRINDSDTAEKEADEEQKYMLHVGWKGLFSFTTRNHLPILSGALLSAVIAAASLPIFAIMYGLIFRLYTDYGAGKIDSSALRDRVTRHCLILTGIASLNWLANSFYFFFFLTFGELQARSARYQIFNALIHKDMVWYDTRTTGIAAFLPTVQMHIRDLQLSVSAPFGEGTQCIVQGIGALGVALYYSWNLTLVILCTVPLIYIVQSFIAHRLSIRANEQATKLKQALKYITNAILSIETVKCFNGEQYELQVFTKITDLAANLYIRVANLRSIQIGVMQFFTLSVFVQGFWYGTHLVRSGERNVGQVITTFWAGLMALQGITGFLPQFIVLQKGKNAGARLRLLMDQISMSKQNLEFGGCKKPARCPGDIEFRQVTFSYPTRPEEVAIRNISLFFPAGETTFVIGRSGSGKSTLGQLLVRFYQPYSGQIFLDGVALDDFDVHWLRRTVTLVEQHSVLFNTTIRDNITLGKQCGTLSLQEVMETVKFAMLDPIIHELPDGLDTELGPGGSSLSGGQVQRMALARAKIRDTPVLILDESTSALDYITRAAVLQAIRDWRKGKTTIVITHDISQIQADEFLCVMENAQVVQEGYRKELEAQSGAFHTLAAAQEDKEGEYSDDDFSDYDYETDEIISLYDDISWNLHSPMHRPMSAVLFGENLLSTFLRKGRGSFVGSVVPGLEKKFSRRESEEDGPQSGFAPSEMAVGAMKLPPGMSSTVPGYTQSRRPVSRPVSMVLQNGRLSGGISYNRALPISKYSGPRRISIVPSPPGSWKNSYPRRLLTGTARNVRSQQSNCRPGYGRIAGRLHLLHSGDADEKCASSTDSLSIAEIFKSVWPTLPWQSRIVVFATFFCAVVHAAATPVFAWIFAQLLTTFYTPGEQSQRSLVYSMIVLGLAFGDGIATYLLFFLADAVAQSWVHALKVEAMRRILMQPREFFDKEENSLSRLAETLDHFAEEARNLPGRFAVLFVVIIFMIAISIVWALVTSWKLALVALACAPILFGITKCYNMISSHWEVLANEANDVVGQVLHETFVNIRTVRCLVLEDYFRAKYEEATTAAINIGIKRALYSASIFGLNFAGTLFVAILFFWYGAVLVASNQYTVSQITETFLVLMLSVNHVNYMGHYITQINMSREAGSRLLRLARLPITSHELTGIVQIPAADDIALNNVNFTYPTRKDNQVLHDVSFTIPQGSSTAIVGLSGSGKSTIASLLLKLYPTDPNTSSIPDVPTFSVSGHDIQSVNTHTLRSKMAIVSQTPVIFPGTIAENITYGLSPSSSQASMESVRAAADAAGVSEFIDSLSHGYLTVIGEGGTGLSGGQAQRIAIARALVRRPDILILDEATSALDLASASVVRDTILRLVRGKDKTNADVEMSMSPRSRSGGFWGDVIVERKKMTVVIITHAREMMAIAEHIIMLDKGRVVEQGSFSELKRRGGAFGRLLRGEPE